MKSRQLCYLVAFLCICLLGLPLVATAECENESCSNSGTVDIKEGEYYVAKKLTGLLGAELFANVEIEDCQNKDEIGCFVSLMVLTNDQMTQFTSADPSDVPNLKFLSQNKNYFPNITLSQNFTTYFQQYSPLDVSVVLFLQKFYSPPVLVVTVKFNIEYTYETCMSAIILSFGFFLGMVLLVAVLCVAITIVRDRKSKLLAENAVLQAEEREKEKLDRYHEDRRLRQQKLDSKWWLNSPSLACQCDMRIFEKPSYIFFPYHWLYSHDWLSIVKRSPSEELSRTNLLLIAVTKLTLCLAVLTAWAPPISNFTSGTIRSVAPFEWGGLIVDLFSKSFVVWLVTEIVGACYTLFVRICQKKGKVENHIVIGGSEYELTALDYATPKWKSMLFFFVYHLPAFLLAILVFVTCIGVIVYLTDKISLNCWTLAGIWIQLAVIEIIYKSIFPGILLSWLKYLFTNSFGATTVVMSPFGEEEGPLVSAFEGDAEE